MKVQPAAISRRTPGDQLADLVMAGVTPATLETCDELVNVVLQELRISGRLRRGGRAALLGAVLPQVIEEGRNEAFNKRGSLTLATAAKNACCRIAAAGELLRFSDEEIFGKFLEFRCGQIGESWDELRQKKDNQGEVAELRLRAALWLWAKSAKTSERRQSELLDAVVMAIPVYVDRNRETLQALAANYLDPVDLPKPTPSVPLPQQLTTVPGWFTGRALELAELTDVFGDAVVSGSTLPILAIVGMGGIGKTALALRWAHQHIERFPDGQLFINLRGFHPTGQPMATAEAIRSFLSAFGIKESQLPSDMEAQAALYRSLVAGKRMLIVLDNAFDADQIAPLLPGSPTCSVIVTSRDKLSGLVAAHGAHRLLLDVFKHEEAHVFLARQLGKNRQEAEPEAFAKLLVYCAGLPLALAIVAGRVGFYANFPLTVFVAALRDTATRLGALDDGDPAASLATVLSWSYDALSPEIANVFGLLGLSPGPDISHPAVSSLTGLPASQAGTAMHVLERVSLVQQHAPDRYRMHDLVKLYAVDCAVRDQSEGSRQLALRRLVDFYLYNAHNADRILDPHREDVALDSPDSELLPLKFTCQDDAWAWFHAEHDCLKATQHCALVRGWYRQVEQLAFSLDTFHIRRGRLYDHLGCWRIAMDAAERLGSTKALVQAHLRLGHTFARIASYNEAFHHLDHALAWANETGNLLGQAHAHYALSWARGQQGDDQEALDHAASAMHLYRTLGLFMREADMLNSMGWYSARLGQYEHAHACSEQALAIFRDHRNGQGEADTLDTLGYIAQSMKQHVLALQYYQEALDLFRKLGHSYDEADILEHLGEAFVALGQLDKAVAVWGRALELYQGQDRFAAADRLRHKLTEMQPAAATDVLSGP